MALVRPKRRFEELMPGKPGTSHLTYHLGGGLDDDGTYYTLLRDGQILHVQIDPFNRMDLELLEEYSEYTSRLTSIQIMLDDIEFGRGDWLYILRDADGNSRFVYKRKPRWITNFIWAPYIDENEIQFTKWDLFGTREGLWNGREVDVYEPSVPSFAPLLERQSKGHLLMQRAGLKDLTFLLLGHLVRDGLVVGNVFEAPLGRLVEYSDRAAVYEAVARIQQKNLVYCDIDSGEIFITDTGVRFGRGLYSVKYVRDKAELEAKAAYWHWKMLEELFDRLKVALGNTARWTRRMVSTEVLIPRLPSPTRPMPTIRNFSKPAFAFAIFVTSAVGWVDWIVEPFEQESSGHSRKRLTAPLDLAHQQRRRPSHAELVIDKPLALSISRVRLRLINSGHPYSHGGPKCKRDDATITSDELNST